MRSRILALIFWSLLIAVPVRATIPLVLEQTLQLPPCTSWDVQHWMDENSFGYAYLRADTVYWAAHMGDAEQTFRLSDSVYANPYWDPPYHQAIRICRSSLAANDPCALVMSIAYDHSSMDNYVLVAELDLITRQIMGMSNFLRSQGDSYCQWVQYEIHDFAVWPQPPSVSTNLWIINWYHGEWSCTGSSSTWEDGNIYRSSLVDVLSFWQPFDGTMIRPFTGTSFLRFAIFHYAWRDLWSHFPPYDGSHTEQRELRVYQPSTGGSTMREDSNANAVWAQTDGGGTQRLIVDYRDGTRALNPDTYDTLWHVPQHIGGEVARFAGSADERILQGSAVYNASNGAYLDQMGSMLGSLRYIIRRPDRSSEFVTYEDATRTVRVYTSLPPVPNRVTCCFVPETGVLRLYWQVSPGAVRYWIYASSTADGQYWPLDHVNAGATSYDITPASPHRFFQVTAEY